MLVKWLDLKQDVQGHAILTICVDTPPSEISEVARKIGFGDQYTVDLKPYRHSKTADQTACIWGKIGELSQVLYTSKDEVYEEMLRRYAVFYPLRVKREALGDMGKLFRLIDIIPERERTDGSVFIHAYKGLSQMDSAEAARLLEGILSECKEQGLSGEVKNDL